MILMLLPLCLVHHNTCLYLTTCCTAMWTVHAMPCYTLGKFELRKQSLAASKVYCTEVPRVGSGRADSSFVLLSAQ